MHNTPLEYVSVINLNTKMLTEIFKKIETLFN